MGKFDYDVVVLGGGAAGLVASKVSKGLGKKVALVEKDKLGGECTWTGCIPSKALIHVASLIQNTKNAKNFGLKFQNELDSAQIMNYVRQKIKDIYQRETPEEIEKKGIDIYKEEASFIDNHTICFNGKIITTSKVIIALGSSPFIPPIEGLDKVSYLTSQTIFDLKKLPKSMIILGGGPIGIEMAGALNRLGVSITIIEMQERLFLREDEELINMLTAHLITEGVNIKTSLKASKVSQKDNEIAIECIDQNNNIVKIETQNLLIAVGKKPNIEGLNLEKAGVEFDRKGIKVNSKLQTTTSNIYACGDIVGPYQFTHMADYQAAIAARNAIIPFFKKHVDYKNVIWVTFSEPELASCGLNEDQARQLYGDSIKIYKQPYSEIDRAVTDNEKLGLAKFVLDKNYKILGAQIFGNRAGELIHEIQLGKYFKIQFFDFYKPIHAYPTYSDLIWKVAKKAYIDSLRDNFLIKLVKTIYDFFKKSK